MKRLAVLLLFLLAAYPAQAQTVTKCAAFDTQSLASAPLGILGTCNITTGQVGIIYATANAEVNCTGTEAVQLLVGSGNSPIAGFNLAGYISSPGVLTVTSNIPGFGNGTIQGFTTVGGSGGTPGTYNNVSLTGGTGIGAKGQLSVSAGGQASVVQLTSGGVEYVVGDTLTASPGGTTGFSITLTSVTSGNPWLIQNGQTLVGVGLSKQTATITGQLTVNPPGGASGMLGTYSISDSSVTGGSVGTPLTDLFTLPTLPGGMTPMNNVFHQSGCNPNFLITSFAGIYVGAPNTSYWLGMTINSDTDGNLASWNNNSILVFTW